MHPKFLKLERLLEIPNIIFFFFLVGGGGRWWCISDNAKRHMLLEMSA